MDFDVIIIGAGVSGLGTAAILRRARPDATFLVLDALDRPGGTWATHHYPGIRSDSSTYTYGFSFKPWPGQETAPGEAILAYLAEIVAEYDLGPLIRHGHRVSEANWSDAARRWTLKVDTQAGPRQFTARFLWLCQGYYDHTRGYVPDIPGLAQFAGPVVHPQTWPDGLETSGKRVVVIGSGSTASTLIPALARDAAHVTMLQRSPGYFFPPFPTDTFEAVLTSLDLPPDWQHEILRRKAMRDSEDFDRRCKRDPEGAARDLIAAVAAQLPPGYDVQRHFTPRYRPWRQRVALVPQGDFFAAIRSGRAEVVTDEIDLVTAQGIRLKSGTTLPADIIVTATGFRIKALGGIQFSVDDRRIDPAQTVTWRGMMFTELPNLAWVFGYLRAAWTPRVELVAAMVLRLLAHMDASGTTQVLPMLGPAEAALPRLPFFDPEDFNAGYLTRGLDVLPRRLDHPEWHHAQSYLTEAPLWAALRLEDSALRFT